MLGQVKVRGEVDRARLRGMVELPDGSPLSDEVVDQLLAGARTEEEIAGPGGLLAALTKRLVERALEVELTEHLGYEPHCEPEGGALNTRNGTSPKTLITEHGKVPIDAPRDRDGSFQPQLVRKRQRRFVGFDEKIPGALQPRALHARHRGAPGGDLRREGRPRADQQGHRRGHGRRPRVGQAAAGGRLPSGLPRRAGAQDPRGRDGAAQGLLPGAGDHARRRPGRLGMSFRGDGEREKFWMQVLTDLKQRGVQDILICCVDGLKGFPEAVEAIFPKATVQTCIVHLIRSSLRYVPRREREQVARDLKPIYTAVDADAAHEALEAFDQKWGHRFPVITQAWLDAWEYVIPFLAFPDEVRRRDLHDECHRGARPPHAQGDQDEGTLPQRGRRAQADLPRRPKRDAPVDTLLRNWTTALLAFKIHFGEHLPDTAS